MKHMKRYLGFLLVAVMVMSFSLPVFAAGENTVTFDGSQMISNLSDASFDGMVPGDEATVSIQIMNTSNKPADWYVKNDIFSALANGRESAGGTFSYELIYDGNVIYASDSMVDNETANGIADQIRALNEFVYLDTLEPNEPKMISLHVAVEGETQRNAYQNSLANLRMSFAATNEEGQRVVRNEIRYANDEAAARTTSVVVQTGDGFNLNMMMTLFVACGVAVLALAIVCLIKDRKRRA